MKPLRLRLQAFGPYNDVAEIDFRDLSLGGLFLIHGQTGAGKTSILDGLCFALFGKSSGSERAPEALRCDLAQTDLATEATLEFSLGIEIYKIVRRPRQQLKKRRGDGLTTALPKGDLFKLAKPSTALDDAEWTLVTSGDKKTDERITELLGMNEEQFRQVVVLPQGQFRKFLAANSDDREKLLERLFRTVHFRTLAERLQRQASDLETKIQSQRRDLNVQLAMAECESFEALEERTNELSVRQIELTRNQGAFLERYQMLAKKRDVARLADQITKDSASCEERKRALESRRSARDQADTRLQNERRARPILVYDGQVSQLDRDLAEVNKKIEIETANLSIASRDLQTHTAAKATLSNRADEIEALREKRRHLQALYVQVQKMYQAAKAATDAEAVCAKAQSAVDLAATEAKNLVQRQNELRLSIKNLDEDLRGLPALRTSIELAKNEIQLHGGLLAEAEGLTKRSDQIAAELADDQKRFADEDETLKRLKIGFHLAQAATLARSLRESEPCPVCGNTEHPHPAAASEITVSPEAIEAAEISIRKLSERLAGHRSSLESAKVELSKRLTQFKAKTLHDLKADLGTKKEGLSLALTKLATLESDERTLATLKRELEKTEALLSSAEAKCRKAESDCAQSKLQQAEVIARLDHLKAEVPPEWRNLASITREGQVLRTTIESFEKDLTTLETKIGAAARAESAAQASLQVLRGDVIAKLSQRSQNISNRDHAVKISGFAALDEARASALTPEQVHDDEALRKHFDEELAACNRSLEDLEDKKRALPRWAFDLQTVEAEFAEIETERSRRDQDGAELNAKLTSLNKLKDQVRLVNTEMKALTDRYSTVGKLAGVAMGQPPHNLSRVNFSRYVLATRLDEVLDQASRRLFLMSRGQFTLRRAQSATDKRKNAGLDLEVEDSFSGSRRSTASLSGGEGFLASLSLALGLADVVQSRLGGVRLEAVFVDEGFGTLDAEALELAIKTLSELQAGGRLVGIISHVPELKDQIARRLYVQKSGNGSRVGWDNALT